MSKQISIAKIARPRLAEVLPRTRLFRLLDKGGQAPVTWVSGPAGAGKTTLVCSYLDSRKVPSLWYQVDEGDADLATFFYYLGLAAKTAAPRHKRPLPLLTPEHVLGIPTFTRRFFENLCNRLNPPFVLVLDNYQNVMQDSLFHDIVKTGLSQLPAGIRAIIVSRFEPPPVYSSMLANNTVSAISWEDMRLTPEEARGIVRIKSGTKRSSEAIQRMHERAQGWAAGVVLLSQGAGADESPLETSNSFDPAKVFEYFASELFDRADKAMQDFLLKTAFLQKITVSMAEKLTGHPQAAHILSELSRSNYFTQKLRDAEVSYQYHALFRDFLLDRARTAYPESELTRIYHEAAVLLEGAGQMEGAAALYRRSEEWEAFARLVLANARSLIAQCRHRPLGEWLTSMPAAMVEQDPWLLYWTGVCRMPFHLTEARGYFERALKLFRKNDDAEGVFLSWADGVESLVQEMGELKRLEPWIKLIHDLMKQYEFPSPGVEALVTARIFTAMPWQPEYPGFLLWRDKALAMIDGDADPSLRMMTATYLCAHYLWIGDYAMTRVVLEVIRQLTRKPKEISFLSYSMSCLSETYFAAMTGAHERCFSMVADYVAKAEESGSHIWDQNIIMLGACCCLQMNDPVKAEQFIRQMAVGWERARPFDKCYYHHVVAWRFMLIDDLSQAMAHEKAALELATKTGFLVTEADCHFAMANLMRASGERKQAKVHIDQCRAIGQRMGSAIMEFMVLLFTAALAFDDVKEEQGRVCLRDALALGRAKGYNYCKWWLPSLLLPLCVKALEAGIETEYAKGLVRTYNLMPEEPPVHIESWPWQVKIFTLGGFKLVVNEKPVAFSGKVQKKPLEMLKVLIAFGGIDVREEQVTDALWPEADGDTARSSFKTTLHRLRQLLGKDEMVLLQEGRVSLDRRLCWSDVWAFERLLREGEAGGKGDGGMGGKGESETGKNPMVTLSPAPRALERALSLYRGHFLSEDEDKPWTVSLRELLKRKFVQAVSKAGEHSENEKAWGKAIAAYERGLEVDDLAEEFYQRLMRCHLARGRRADALKVYNRCKRVFTANLGVEPSEETERLYRNITEKGK